MTLFSGRMSLRTPGLGALRLGAPMLSEWTWGVRGEAEASCEHLLIRETQSRWPQSGARPEHRQMTGPEAPFCSGVLWRHLCAPLRALGIND